MNQLLELGLFALLVAATSVGAAVAVRQAPVIRRWNEDGVKPWACDLCMTFWLTGIVCAVGAFLPDHDELWRLWCWMPAFAIAYPWLARINPMPEADGDFPGLPHEPPTMPRSGEPDGDDEAR